MSLLLAIFLLSGLGLLSAGGAGSAHLAAPHAGAHFTASAAPKSASSPLAGPHGDLIVGPSNSPYTISPAVSGVGVYAQAGNISVLPGGTLIVKNITIDFVQYVASSGTIAQRLSHLYWFSVEGSATFLNSTVTTETGVINAFTKLNFNVSAGGHVTLVHSSFAFPGWVTAYGAGTTLLLNSSNFTSNSNVIHQIENLSLVHDTQFSPTVTVAGGAHAALENSSVLQYYKDNTTHWGMPGPAPVDSPSFRSINSGAGTTWSSWVTPTDSENLSRAVLYSRIAGGTISFTYTTTATATAPATLNLGAAFPLGTVNFPTGTTATAVTLSAAAVAQINSIGVLGYLNSTGDWGAPATLSLSVGPTSQGSPTNISNVEIDLVPVLSYNVTVTGAQTILTAVDTVLNLNWNLTPGASFTRGTPIPWSWGSTKLYLLNGAVAYLANITVTTPRAGVFWNSSAILPDASSAAYFYRWAEIPVTGVGNTAISGAKVSAFYAYDTNQLNNQTATNLNLLATADPDLGAYVSGWVAQHHLSGYGVSDAQGHAMLMLASGYLTTATLPDGIFLGGYHFGVALAGGGAGATQWVYASLTPYPLGLTPAGPDVSAAVNYANFRPILGFGSVTVSVEGAAVSVYSAEIGQTVSINATVTNTGTGPVSSYSGNLSYLKSKPVSRTPLGSTQQFGPLTAGSSRPITLSWLVNETVVGRHGGPTNATLVAEVVWNGGTAPLGGIAELDVNVTIVPSPIHLYLNPPGGTYDLTSEYAANGTVTFSGTGTAYIIVNATASDGTIYTIGVTNQHPGRFNMTILPDPSMKPGTYSLNATATYNGRSVYFLLPNWFTVPGSSPPPPSFLNQKYGPFTGLQWLLIAGLVAIVLVAAVLVMRRQARGKLVECGECGQLIPEDATVCPKCGAEFEPDLVRCSRCASTIPADSKVCPECAAQLLGRPEEAARDPERQGYADFVERFRADAKKELQDNYNEGAFWDWWKRQPTYLPFNQWRLQQSQGSRAGMTAPPTEPVAPPPQPGLPSVERPCRREIPAAAGASTG